MRQPRRTPRRFTKRRLEGLPAGPRGHARLRLRPHRLVGDTVADGAGRTGFVEVTPPIRPGATLGAAVELIRPACVAVMVPGSLSYGSARGVFTRGAGFEFIQTLG